METSGELFIPDPPSKNPLQYCRLCFSPFRVEPVFPVSGEPNEHLLKQISSLVQIELNAQRDASCAVCFMCQLQLEEFHLFRERCRQLDESIRRKPLVVPVKEEPSEPVPEMSAHQISSSVPVEKEDDLWFAVEGVDDEMNGDVKEDRHQLAAETSTAAQQREYDEESYLNVNFWNAIARDVGIIPEHVRHALELVGFCRNAALGQINEDTIKSIEQDMRNSVALVMERERGNAAGMRKYYGGFHCNNPNKFSFFAGEAQTILSIARAVREYGISKYLKAYKSLAGQTNKPSVLQPVASAEEHGEMLIKRIKAYYSARAQNSLEYHNFFRSLDHIRIVFSRDVDTGKHVAQVQCYLCPDRRLLRLSTDRQERFMVANFMKHCEIYHYKLPELAEDDPRRKRRRRTQDEYMREMSAASTSSGIAVIYSGQHHVEQQQQQQEPHQQELRLTSTSHLPPQTQQRLLLPQQQPLSQLPLPSQHQSLSPPPPYHYHQAQMQMPIYRIQAKAEPSAWINSDLCIKNDYVELSDDD